MRLVLSFRRCFRSSVATEDGTAYVRKWVMFPLHKTFKRFRNCLSKQTSLATGLLRSGLGFESAAEHVHKWVAPSKSQIRHYVASMGLM